jgi:hypothetical protein
MFMPDYPNEDSLNQKVAAAIRPPPKKLGIGRAH